MAEVELYVDGRRVPTNRFVGALLKDILMAFLKNLRNVEAADIRRVDIST